MALGRASAAAMALALLGACAEMPGAAATGSGSDGPGILRIEEREVERPDIYELEARGLWDGRFSLGGRWVAVTDQVDAERVRIVNLANGRAIEGGLFRREVNLPGPPLMVSMDAAEALGMQAGTPVEMRVVALRTETVEIPAPPPAAPAATPAGEPPEAAAETPAEAAADGAIATTALAAIEAADADAGAPPPPAQPAAPASGRRLQVASGSNQEGADAVLRRLRGAEIPAEIRTAQAADGTAIYRVVAGPFPDADAYDAALARIRELGYADAFAVR
ncbi:SPOR domain-containing protein [Halovulum dunhuangense]|uniref:SPOR domain-containing protein n=1 Tax=Halovulum dunhuangense TaxID=1505036 RepID=A0A849L259_9RHOB|nr:SPOR domain-containing protein [Halovulum dunhuangense]NNU80396.1 SPOR domain-containing protein [Halovulum dunhuangense]